ncbi:MAG TPA: amino acid permease [Thermoanaerobaculia bacterium]|nr:amino acid permease [Thermoanaerobaculia bacterium]
MSFRRALGPFDATMVVVGGIIGSGIFINPYIVAQRLSSGGLVLAAWVVGGAIALAGAFAFAELGALFPNAGGEYVYLREAYHPGVAFLFGWASLLMIQGGGLAAVAIAFSQYTLRLVGGNPASAAPLAVAAIALVAAVNYAGVKPGSRLLNVLVVAKVAALAVLIGGGLFLARRPAAAAAPASSFSGGSGLVAFGAALIPILFTYGGWQSANIIAEEMREPRRTLPLALVAGTAIVILIYLLANVVYLSALTREGLAATTTPAADAVRRIFGPGADRLISAAITISAFGFLDLTLLAQTRIYYAMGADRLFFEGLGRLHPRFQTPSLAILLQAAWGVVLVLTGTYADLVDSVVFGDWIFFTLTVASVFLFRRRFPIESRPPGSFRSPGYPWFPAFFVVTGVAAVASAIASNPRRSLIGTGLLATGVPVYLFYANRRGDLPPLPSGDGRGEGAGSAERRDR